MKHRSLNGPITRATHTAAPPEKAEHTQAKKTNISRGTTNEMCTHQQQRVHTQIDYIIMEIQREESTVR